jgi:uncharacterized membrane protein YfcA
VLLALIGATVVFAGTQVLRRRGAASGPGPSLSSAFLLLAGMAVGFASAITGTGGPVLLVPWLIWLGVPVLAAVGLSQAIQVPIAVMATAGNLLAGTLDLGLGAWLSVGVMIGVAIGARIAHAVPALVLARTVAVALLGVGVFLVIRAAEAAAAIW